MVVRLVPRDRIGKGERKIFLALPEVGKATARMVRISQEGSISK